MMLHCPVGLILLKTYTDKETKSLSFGHISYKNDSGVGKKKHTHTTHLWDLFNKYRNYVERVL